MTRQEAFRVLQAWRPGVDDADPDFAPALAFAQSDADLRAWVEEERARYAAIRAKLTEIPVPAGLAAAILEKRPALSPARPQGGLLKLAAAIALLAGGAGWWLWQMLPYDFSHYETYIAQVIPVYSMSLETRDAGRIRDYLARNQSPADYTVPAGLGRTTPLGCATFMWNGRPGSMLCFRDETAGKPGRDLWLFVVDRGAIPFHRGGASTEMNQWMGYGMAAWESGGKTYVLAAKGALPEGYL